MYNLPSFKEQDQQVVLQFIKQNPFAMLIGCSNNIPVATQVPLLIEEREQNLYLTGHIMKHTDHHKAFLQNDQILCVFTGPHTYVSASWYDNPLTASTWNYMSVHAKGRLKFLDQSGLIEVLRRTTTHFENNPYSPASFDKLPHDYVQHLAKAIVAFEIKVDSIDHVFKLSQNRNKESYTNIIRHLENKDADAQKIAQEMKDRYENKFEMNKE